MCQGTTNSTYQPGPPGTGSLGPVAPHVGTVTGRKLPQVVAPTTTPWGYVPVNSGSGMGPMQPPSPTQQGPVQPAITPAAPPPTVQTVDTSKVPGNHFPPFSICKILHQTWFLCVSKE